MVYFINECVANDYKKTSTKTVSIGFEFLPHMVRFYLVSSEIASLYQQVGYGQAILLS